MFHHLFYSQNRIETGGIALRYLTMDALTKLGSCARVCVWIFAFLSAYGLTIQYKKMTKSPDFKGSKSRFNFIVKHYLSLMKPYWFVFVLVTIVSPFLFHMSWAKTYDNNIIYLLLNACGLSDFFHTPTPNGAWWYMCFAQILLLLIPFLAEAVRKYGGLVPLMSFILIQYLGDGILSKSGGAYSNYLTVITFGVWFAWNDVMPRLSKRPRSILGRFVDLISLVMASIVCIWIQVEYSSTDTWKYTKVFIAIAAVLLILIIYKYFRFSWLERILAFLGKHSGNMFMTHSFFYMYYIRYVYWSHNVLLTWLTLVVASLIVSLLIESIKALMRKSSLFRRLV